MIKLTRKKNWFLSQTTVPTSCEDFKIGCLEAFQDYFDNLLKRNPWTVGGIGIGVLVLLLLGMILSGFLFFKKAQKGKNKSNDIQLKNDPTSAAQDNNAYAS